jgi:conjugative relaxase-like TrwC/TraI family protein
MLRFRPLADAKAALSYYGKSDGGYYLDGSDLRREVGGKLAEMLGLSGEPDPQQFERLLNGLHPKSGEQLTAKLVDNRLAGWDVTASVPKGVTIAAERGDRRVSAAIWEAGREAMADLEQNITTRERAGGRYGDRVTGNMAWFGFEHPETRPAKEDGMPDPDRHIHFVIVNATYDAAEGKVKAIKFRPIMDDRKFFDRCFDHRLASKLTDLGYEIETKRKADGKYFTWDIKGIPASLVKKNSRRTSEVEAIAEKLGIESPVSKDKLGATSRLMKRDDMTLADYRAYWNSRVAPEEARAVDATIQAALSGQNRKPVEGIEKGVAYALDHHFERKSVVRVKDIAITAMERSMGAGTLEQVFSEAQRQGLLTRGGEATTRQVLAEEGRVIGFARDGRGTCRPMGARPGSQVEAGAPLKSGRVAGDGQSVRESAGGARHAEGTGHIASNFATTSALAQPKSAADQFGDSNEMVDLSPEQAAIARHVWNSTDRVILIRGAAGTGKTHTMKATIAGLDRHAVVLAPSADASRGVLRSEGFTSADTVARFLIDEKFQEQARDGVIWVDEAGLLGIRQVREVFDAAERLNARVVLQGDKRQHGSVERGATLRVLEQYAGLPVAELKDIRRQKGRYKDAVASLAKGAMTDGFDRLDDLGWVQEVASNAPLVDDYLAGLDARKSMLVVAPTHAEGGEITAEIRERLKERGRIASEGQQFGVLVPLGWTEAERGDMERYEGTEVMVFHRNSGTFKAGDRKNWKDWKPGDRFAKAAHFQVYAPASIEITRGDRVRITGNGVTKDKKHKLNNGTIYSVGGFTKDGDLVLDNGWVVAKDYGHIAHGYVTTSHASQGKTVDRVLISMGSESVPAINAEQFYVSVSRGRERATIYSDLPREELRAAVQKADPRKSATELVRPQMPRPVKPSRDRLRRLAEKTRAAFRQLREKAVETIGKHKQREREYERTR